MCGIAGLLQFHASLAASELTVRARRMSDALVHRGPDADGVWVDERAGIALSHRRLSILDLSSAGAQPMSSHGGRFMMVYNGEVYNHAEIRAALGNTSWRGHSDTEVLLEGFARWGIEATLQRAVGMFAMAVWDTEARELILARDRIGEKPLYYGITDNALVFGSELKALRTSPGWRADIDRDALDDFMRRGCVHAPRTIFTHARKLMPGSYLRVPLNAASRSLELLPEFYWSLEGVVERQGGRGAMRDEDAIRELERLLKQSVAGQMVADVPVGAFLSGGVDSSTAVALMQAQSTQKVRTFSIGFHEPAYDESVHARAIAKHLGTDHTDLYVTAEETRAVIPQLPTMYDEPFADSSQIPTFLVSKLARQQVTVSLSGDGGDELFGGYDRYATGARLWSVLRSMPESARTGIATGVRALSANTWDTLWKAVPAKMRVTQPGDKMHKLAAFSRTRGAMDVYDLLMSQHREEAPLVVGVTPVTRPLHGLWNTPGRHIIDNMMLADALGFLPDVIMTKVDRAAMAVSLETRAPYLDHRVVEFAFGLPLSQKVRGDQNKWILREVLFKHVPRVLIERPKMGFNVPIDGWLRGPLKDWAHDLLRPQTLAQQGYLCTDTVRAAWEGHQNRSRSMSNFLWNALMFQSWLSANG
jgi:asparagine synthase (glutamine-hydrolysing)